MNNQEKGLERRTSIRIHIVDNNLDAIEETIEKRIRSRLNLDVREREGNVHSQEEGRFASSSASPDHDDGPAFYDRH